MSLRTLILLSPFVLAVILGRAVTIPEESPERETGPLHNFSMNRYLGKDRPLLVFSPSREDASYCETMIIWNRNVPELEDRDLALIEVFEEGISRAKGREIPRDSAAELRSKYQVELGKLTIILVGKDGTEKGRFDQLFPLQDVYDHIDTMPMRKQEVRSRQDARSE
ncbi:DUF4174 domain-containing protein [Tautonia sp. JC769]|uniref:DUF4174 domain-containing protein n=1 Tax=Tautonia sp. JC769 TaxID=3232135 RepID=UPI00345A510E